MIDPDPEKTEFAKMIALLFHLKDLPPGMLLIVLALLGFLSFSTGMILGDLLP